MAAGEDGVRLAGAVPGLLLDHQIGKAEAGAVVKGKELDRRASIPIEDDVHSFIGFATVSVEKT